MKRILIFGMGPLPIDPSSYNHSGGIRTMGFINAIRSVIPVEEIDIVLILPNIMGVEKEPLPRTKQVQDLEVTEITERDAYDGFIDKRLQNNQYDAVVGVTTFSNYILSQCRYLTVPWWADLHGDFIVEGQSKAYIYKDNTFMYTFVDMLRQIVRTADYFSTCSDRQKYMLIGEMALEHRLSRENEGVDPVHHIPILFDPEKRPITRSFRTGEPLKLLWIGGYNTWADVETLFNGLIFAMEQNPNIQFISTGGAIAGHDDKSYTNFRAAVDACPFADNFTFHGYVSETKLDELMKECHVGLNVDRFNYEGVIGGRNRVNSFTTYGMPVITTPVSEIPAILTEKKLVLSFTPGNAQEFADQILYAYEHWTECEQMADRAFTFLLDYCDESRIFSPVVEWVQSPRFTHKPKDANPHAPEKLLRKDKQFFADILKFGYKHAILNLLKKTD
jgi:glycosyltransferase involved in cell wall biosynthesis